MKTDYPREGSREEDCSLPVQGTDFNECMYIYFSLGSLSKAFIL